MRLILIRHGETEWALSGRHTSRTDLALTENGRAQAAALKSGLEKFSLAAVLSSPRRRARETAELAGVGHRVEVAEDLREFDYGDYEGLTKAEILAKNPNWNIFKDGCPGGETLAQVAERANRVVARARESSADTMVFTHGHLGRILAACWLGLPPEFAAQLKLDTATLSIFAWENNLASLQTWNS